MKVVTVSSKRQITLPKEVLDLLEVKPQEKLILRVTKTGKRKTAFLEPLRTTIVNQTAGSLTHHVHKSKLGTPLYKILTEAKKTTSKKLAEGMLLNDK
jgi:bifunctional DNA-binding transcriptional regulator/antitoxin component of YhaV-PrlF toxin-antitoxin module